MQLAELRIDADGRVLTASLGGEIDMSNAAEIGTSISRRVANEAFGLVLDLSAVTYLDSAAIQVIFELHERLATRGQQLWLVLPPGARTADALTLAGVPQVVRIAATPDEARQAIETAAGV